ncbi:MAG: PAS domain S-box protein [Chitinophagaceae bacterium]
MLLENAPYSHDKAKLYDLLLDNTDEGLILIDKTFNIAAINRAGVERIKEVFSKEVNVGSSMFEFTKPDRLPFIREVYARVFRGEPVSYQVTANALDGKRKTYTILSRPAFEKDGSIFGALVNTRDITQEVERVYEQEIALGISSIFTSKHLLSDALEGLLHLLCKEYRRDAAEIWIGNIDGTALLRKASAHCVEEGPPLSFEKGRGLPGACWAGQQAIYISDLQRDELFRRKPFAKANNFVAAEAIPIINMGTTTAVLVFFQKQGNNTGTAVPSSILFHTGNEIRRKDAEDRLNRFFELSPDVFSIAGTDGYFKILNASFPRMLGFSMEEVLAVPYYDLIHPDDLKATEVLVDELAGGLKSSYFENRFRAKDGSYRWFAWTSTSLEEEGLIFGVAKDITEKKKAEQLYRELNSTLEKRADELAASNAELERFAYVASHDLQEPLRMVSSFLQLLQKKYKDQLDETAHQYIHFAVDGAERMKKLILDLLAYSRVGTNSEVHTFVDMNQVFSEVKTYFNTKINELNAEVNAGQLPVVKGNPTQMKQVIQNLVGNALKYHSDAPPKILINSKELNGEWIFCVEDNGIGVDPRFAEKIFIIFQRLHNSSEYEGTGIGLAIARKIVEKHGGKIWVEANTPSGSKFYFSIRK